MSFPSMFLETVVPQASRNMGGKLFPTQVPGGCGVFTPLEDRWKLCPSMFLEIVGAQASRNIGGQLFPTLVGGIWLN